MNEFNALLAEQVRRNDPSAFATLFGRYHSLVFNVCLKDWGISLPGNANPVELVRKPRGDNPRERRLSPDEYEVIRQVPIFNWAIETAMRRGVDLHPKLTHPDG